MFVRIKCAWLIRIYRPRHKEKHKRLLLAAETTAVSTLPVLKYRYFYIEYFHYLLYFDYISEANIVPLQYTYLIVTGQNWISN